VTDALADALPDDPDSCEGPDGSGSPDASERSERAREGVEHLQAAGRELIAAARAALDVAEDLLDDPETAASLAGAVGSLGDLVRNVTASWRGPLAAHPNGNGTGTGDGAMDGAGQAGPPDDGVERIVVT
jgi:hypothetical protein